MPRYYDRGGLDVKADDPDRMLWRGACGYWTDDWSKWNGLIPKCPKCRCFGKQVAASVFFEDARREEAGDQGEPRPGLIHFITETKETCFQPEGGFQSAFEERSLQCST